MALSSSRPRLALTACKARECSARWYVLPPPNHARDLRPLPCVHILCGIVCCVQLDAGAGYSLYVFAGHLQHGSAGSWGEAQLSHVGCASSLA